MKRNNNIVNSPGAQYNLYVMHNDGTNTFTYTANTSMIDLQVRQQGTYYLDNIKIYSVANDTIINKNELVGGYRYGFNGQLKDDELYGAGNSYTAQFWQYDPRLGRRWNIDPVTKPWQSPYSCFSDNPIWKLDPNGDDDYFNSKGQLVKRTKTGTKIYIQTARGNVLYNKLSMSNMHNRQTLANVTGYYAAQVGVNKNVGVSNYPKNRNSKALAFTEGNSIYVNARVGGVGVTALFNDYNNLKNALVHEKIHKERGQGFHEISDFEHAEVYLAQIKDPTFAKTTKTFKKAMVGSIAHYLKKAAYHEMRKGNGDFTALNKLVSDFNKQSGTTGYTFDLVQTKSGWSIPKNYQYEVYATPIKSEKK